MTVRLCLCGAESTGKTTIARAVAARLKLPLIPEYGRLYAEERGAAFTQADLRAIAVGHRERTLARLANRPLVVIEDTDVVMTAAWNAMLYGTRDPVIDAVPADADVYLLFTPGVPWIDDGTRHFGTPALRASFHAAVEIELARRAIRPVRVSGGWGERESRLLDVAHAHGA